MSVQLLPIQLRGTRFKRTLAGCFKRTIEGVPKEQSKLSERTIEGVPKEQSKVFQKKSIRIQSFYHHLYIYRQNFEQVDLSCVTTMKMFLCKLKLNRFLFSKPNYVHVSCFSLSFFLACLLLGSSDDHWFQLLLKGRKCV